MKVRNIKKFLVYLTFLAGIVLLAFFLLLGSVYYGIFGPLPERDDLLAISNEQASLVFSDDGSLIGKFFAENRTNISWDNLPPHLVNALVSTEDKRFFEHQGIDSRSYLRVLVKTLLLGNRSSGGGSTLTQQLVKNLYGREQHGFLSLPVSKLREAIIASRMEDVMTKQEILLLYLNSVPFGEEVFGVEAAAKRFFNKTTSELSIEESAVLIGILKANTYYNPRLHPENAIKRRNQVLALMEEEGFLDPLQADSLKNTDLKLSYTNYNLESPAGYFVFRVKKKALEILEKIKGPQGQTFDLEKNGLKIYTTLDLKLQQLANRAAHDQLKRMQPLLEKQLVASGKKKKWIAEFKNSAGNNAAADTLKEREYLSADGLMTKKMTRADSAWYNYSMLHAAVLACDPTSGAVKVWVGGNNFRYLPYDQILAVRQMASTIKPFIYSSALEQGFEPCDYFENREVEYENYPDWNPQNYDKSYSEDFRVAMWYALSRSLNLPTVDLYFQTGHKQVADLCRRFGLEAPFEETPAIALGALDASLLDVVRAYSVFANNGLLPDELFIISRITDNKGNIIYEREKVDAVKVIDPGVAETMNSMLRVAINEGTGTKLRNQYGIRAALAGKTGTAQQYSDAWFITYSPGLVLGVRIGAMSQDVHFQTGLGSGSSLALPVAGAMIAKAEKDPTLKNRYFVPFIYRSDSITTFDCEPFYETGIEGIFHRWTGKNGSDSVYYQPQKRHTTKKQDSKFKEFFRNLFKRKKK